MILYLQHTHRFISLTTSNIRNKMTLAWKIITTDEYSTRVLDCMRILVVGVWEIYYLFSDILRQLLCSFSLWNITQWIRCNSSVCLKLTSMNNWSKWVICCTSYECVIYFSWWKKIYWDNCLSATIKK